MRRGVALYPLTPTILPVVMHWEQLQPDYRLASLLAPSGFSVAGHDAGHMLHLPDTGIRVDDRIDSRPEAWDILLAVETAEDNEGICEERLELVRWALSHEKLVHYIGRSPDSVPDGLRELAGEYEGRVRITTLWTKREDLYPKEKLHRFQVPLVLVGGLIEEADVFAMLVKLYARLVQDGERPLVVTKQPIGGLLGFASIEPALCALSVDEAEKIERINVLLKDLETREQPSIILLEAPDAVMKYNNYLTNGFGIRTYMLAQAAEPDAFLCCIPSELGEMPFVEEISRDFSLRLGVGIDAVHVSNAVIDGVDFRQERKLYLTHTTLEDIDGRIRQQREAYPEGNCLFNGWTEDFEGLYHTLFMDAQEEAPPPQDGAAPDPRAWLLELLGSKFGVPEEMLAKGNWDLPLTGEFFGFSGMDLFYLLLEVEKRPGCSIPVEALSDYQFNSISTVLKTLETIPADIPASQVGDPV